jgi:hypothetical protein
MLRDSAVALLAFAAGTGLAELLGAVNLGTALGIGQICFALALVWVVLRPRPRRPGEPEALSPS